MRVELDDAAYGEMTGDFQAVTMHLLDEVLRGQGIGDSAQRRRICDRFSERFGVFVDQGWFRGVRPEAYPLLAIAERGPFTDTEHGALERILIPRTVSLLAETLSGTAGFYFDEQGESLQGEIEVWDS